MRLGRHSAKPTCSWSRRGDQHPRFQEAGRDKHSRFRDFYVSRGDKPGDTSEQVVFPGQENSIWDFDPVAEAYYLHRFYKHQPDLNIGNPAVRHAICKIMGFCCSSASPDFA